MVNRKVEEAIQADIIQRNNFWKDIGDCYPTTEVDHDDEIKGKRRDKR